MTANTGSAVEIDMLVQQGADWPGIRVPILDAVNAPFDPSSCTATGEIRLTKRGPLVFTWSNAPATGEGLITLNVQGVTWRLLAAETTDWLFTEARYEINLVNPAGPVGQRNIRVAQGAVVLDPQLDR